MLKYISILIVLLTLCIIYDLTYKKISQFKQILIMLSAIIVILYAKHSKETFNSDYLKEMNKTNTNMTEFCKELSLLDKHSENTLLMKNFKDKIIDRNNKEIKRLRGEIDKYYIDKINSEVNKKQQFMLSQHTEAKEQLKSINLAKHNLINKNNLKLNIT